MKFEPGDYDWSDWHEGLSSERMKRYADVTEAIYVRVLEILGKHHGKITMQAIVPIGIFTKGVRGDGPMYAPVVLLFAHRKPSYAKLAKISQAITNTLPVSRVSYCVSKKIPKDLISGLIKEGGTAIELKPR